MAVLIRSFLGYNLNSMDEHNHRRPSIRDFFTNMSGPMPLKDKIRLLLRNNAIKIKNRQNCCGHPGEPGC